MADDIGIDSDEVLQIAQGTQQIVEVLEALLYLCDGTSASLADAMLLPGAAPVVAPVTMTFASIRPTLVKLIADGRFSVDFMTQAVAAFEATDDALNASLTAISDEVSGLGSVFNE